MPPTMNSKPGGRPAVGGAAGNSPTPRSPGMSPTSRKPSAEDKKMAPWLKVLARGLGDADEELAAALEALAASQLARKELELENARLTAERELTMSGANDTTQQLLQRSFEQDEHRRAAEEETRNTLRRVSELAQELAAERARCSSLLEEMHRERAASEKLRSAMASMRMTIDEAAVSVADGIITASPVDATYTSKEQVRAQMVASPGPESPVE